MREANGLTWADTPLAERVWLLEIACRYGTIYPWGGDVLAAAVTNRRVGTKVATLAGILTSRGDSERVATFNVKDAENVFALMKPYRRRHLSPERRAKLVQMGRQHRFAGLKVSERAQNRRTGRGNIHEQPRP